MGTMTIPAAPEAITAEWLTAALREGGVIGDAKVASIDTEIVGAGVGFIGQLARVRLTYDVPEANAPSSLIAKFPIIDPSSRAIGNLFRLYEREVRFYEEIGTDAGLCAPRRYFSHADVDGDQYILLIEDMARARLGNDLEGCSIEQAELVVRSAAAFHARWWQSEALLKLAWMPFINDPVYQSAEHTYQQTWPLFLNSYGGRVSARVRKHGEALQNRVIALLDVLVQEPLTMSHGDYRADNMFFGPGAQELTLCDWQISSKCNPAFDIAYFLSMSVAADLRKAEEMRLLRLWHDGLAEGGVRGYGWDQALRDYRLGVLFSWIYVVISIGSLDAANERGMALFDTIFERRQHAFEELDVGELLPK